MFDRIKADYRHACSIECYLLDKSFFRRLKSFLSLFFHCYGLQVVISYRFYRWTSTYHGRFYGVVRCLLGAVAFLQHKLLEFMYDIYISPKANIGAGLYIGHFGGIRINTCSIGCWCNINQQVVIGRTIVGQEEMQTTIGDHVWVGAHSKIEPGVTVGEGATISVGTPVSKDIPPFSLVAGSSCRVLQKEYDNSVLLGLIEEKV